MWKNNPKYAYAPTLCWLWAFWLFSHECYNGLLGAVPTNNKAIEVQLMKQLNLRPLRATSLYGYSRPQALPAFQCYTQKSGRAWEIMSCANYCAWTLVVLTTATESIDSKGTLFVACLADPRLVMLANSIACHCEAFSHYRSRSRHRQNDWSKTARKIVACWSWQWRTTVLNLKFIDRLLSSLLSISKNGTWTVATLKAQWNSPLTAF